jgi:fibrillarin-like rRNA methylase
VTPKMFLSPETYNYIYSDKTGIMISTKVSLDPSEYMKDQNKKLKKQNMEMKKTLEYIAKYHKDHVSGSLAQECLDGIL